MKTVLAISLVVVTMASGSAKAQFGLDIWGGFAWAKAVRMQPGAIDDFEMKSGFIWGASGLDLFVGRRDISRTAFNIGVGALKTTSMTMVTYEGFAFQAEADTKVIMPMGWGRLYLTPSGQQTRAFFEAGGGFTNIVVKITASGYGESVSMKDEINKGCFGGGIGFQHRVNQWSALLVRIRYVYVHGITGEFDPSQLMATVGVGFGG